MARFLASLIWIVVVLKGGNILQKCSGGENTNAMIMMPRVAVVSTRIQAISFYFDLHLLRLLVATIR